MVQFLNCFMNIVCSRHYIKGSCDTPLLPKKEANMNCTLFETLEALDKKLEQLEKSIGNCRIEAQAAKAEMNEVKRLIKEIKKK